jgi:Fe-S cluster assembly scaffold protein SufB
MKTIELIDANTRINESCHIIDRGIVDIASIVIGEGVQVEYCFVAPAHVPPMNLSNNKTIKLTRHITIGAHTTFVGTGIMMDQIEVEIITEVVWDHVSSTLDLLALATDQSKISIEWIVRVSSPYRQVSTRVDQTNILIGSGARVRGVPRLEISTDDIEWGHSCRIHRLGGESLFYLTSRGLTHEHAETLLLQSEVSRHLRTVDGEIQEVMRGEVERRVRK